MKTLTRVVAPVVLCLAMCASIAEAQRASLANSLEVKEHQPIVLQSDIETPEGWSALHIWDVDKPARLREWNGGKVATMWAPPGTYEVELRVILAKGKGEAVEFRQEQSVTTVVVKPTRPGPQPPVPPVPDPLPPEPKPPGPLPSDFGNAAQRAWEATKDVAAVHLPQVLAQIENTAKRMEQPGPNDLSLNAIWSDLREGLVPAPKLFEMIEADVSKFDMSKQQMAGYLRHYVSKGVKHGRD